MKQRGFFLLPQLMKAMGGGGVIKKKMQKGGYSGLVLPQLMKAMDSKGSVIKNTTKKKMQKGRYFWGEKNM